MITEQDINFKIAKRLSLTNMWHTLGRDNELGLQCEIMTKKDASGFAKGKPKHFYFIDNDSREFLNIDELVEAYNEKFQFKDENPEHEVFYVKIIKKRTDKLTKK